MRAFGYVRAADAASAVQAGGDGAAFLSGGTTLLDLMKLDVLRPSRVVDINDLEKQFGQIGTGRDGLHLGAFVRMGAAAEHPGVLRDYPVVAQALQLAASQQIRNMASLGGNVLQRTRCNYFRDPSWPACNKRNPGSGCAALQGVNRKHAVLGTSDSCIATYPGDFAQALIALDADVDIVGINGPRVMRFADLHREPGTTPERETNLAPDELITGFTLPPLPFARRSLYLKIRDRQSYEFALASAAVVLDLDGGNVREARIALGGVATRPWRAREAEAVLTGKPLTPDTARTAAQAAFAGAVTRGQNDYKPELGRRTLVRALLQAAAMEI
jgi:xanthine dehydrogenase YagS FAD-binding subunit